MAGPLVPLRRPPDLVLATVLAPEDTHERPTPSHRAGDPGTGLVDRWKDRTVMTLTTTKLHKKISRILLS